MIRARTRKTAAPLLHNEVHLLSGGRPLFRKLEDLIAGAKESIHIQTYIFEDDATGRRIAEALMEAAGRGVRVYLLVDGYASKEFSPGLQEGLRKSRVAFRLFEPLFRSSGFYLGRRLHHKVYVFDGRRALVSGSNIADRYDDRPEAPAWLDLGLYLEGPAAAGLESVCMSLWQRRQRGRIRTDLPPPQTAAPSGEGVPVRICRNDWIRGYRQILRSYLRLFGQSRERILIMCSYFLPGLLLRRHLEAARRRGVAVTVVLAGVSDVPVSKHAERWLYRWMLRHGIRVYEYRKTVLHAKVAIADGRLLTAGSYNLNNLSAYASVELNLEVEDAALAGDAEARIRAIMEEDCTEIDTTHYANRLWSLGQFWRFCCYQGLRLVMAFSKLGWGGRE